MNVPETELGVNTVDGHVFDVQMAGAACRGRKAKTWDAVVGMEHLAAGLKIPPPVHPHPCRQQPSTHVNQTAM